jgi:hypothetical protein
VPLHWQKDDVDSYRALSPSSMFRPEWFFKRQKSRYSFLSRKTIGWSKSMADRISKLPRGKKIPPIDVVRARLRNHVEVVLASYNEPLIRMVEWFFSETIDRLIQERPKGKIVPIKQEIPKTDK